MEVLKDRGTWRNPEDGWTFGSHAFERYSVQHDDLASLRGETRWIRTFSRGDWEVRTVTRTVLTSDESVFRIAAELDAYEGEHRVHCRSWQLEIPRRLV